MIGQSKPYFGQLDIAVSKTDSNGLFNTTDIKNETKISTRTLTMSQNYPNPFNAQTKIFFSIAINSDIVFRVFDNSGKLVNEMRLGTMSAGNHTISLCKLNLASGVYFYCFLASNSEANEVVTRKFVLLK
ncbi:MAG: T9SS type A sorting domain-containing protein [Ignavibacteria bacterium]|nr:T9SS type A sorting domain-containing protein [Ignavibacteria bacterium]